MILRWRSRTSQAASAKNAKSAVYRNKNAKTKPQTAKTKVNRAFSQVLCLSEGHIELTAPFEVPKKASDGEVLVEQNISLGFLEVLEVACTHVCSMLLS